MIDRRLHVLRMLRQHGTVTAAARELHLTPSAVSQQLRSLARDLDLELLVPEGRRVRLTPAADLLLEHADRLASEWERARGDLDAHRVGGRGPLRLAAFPSVLVALLPEVVQRLRDEGLAVEAVQADPAESLDLLLAGEVDLAVLETSPAAPATADPRFERQELFDDPLELVVPPDHPLAARGRPVSLAEAADEPWIGGPPEGSFHQIELLACAQAGVAPTFVHRALDWSAYLAMVRAGLGVALLPRLAVDPSQPVRHLSLADTPMPTRRVLTCVRRGSSEQHNVRRLRDALTIAATAAGHRDAAPASRG
jgi:DNA-binding transcriptional LysR family regulator